MPFSGTPNGRIAAHFGNSVQRHSEHQCFAAHTRRGKCCFTARMASANYNDVVLFRIFPKHIFLLGKALHAAESEKADKKPLEFAVIV